MIGVMRAGLWTVLAIGILLAGVGFADGLRPSSLDRAPQVLPVREPAPLVRQAGESLAVFLVSMAPFRASRRPASMPYQPGREVVAAGPVVPPPALALHGIVWGTRPGAVLEGIPGVAGDRLLLPGDTVGGIRIRRIERTRVTIDGLDTTWVLRLPFPRG